MKLCEFDFKCNIKLVIEIQYIWDIVELEKEMLKKKSPDKNDVLQFVESERDRPWNT